MPEILEKLLGLKFIMYYMDNDSHHRPHVHVEFGGHKASIAIDKIELLAGYLPSKKLKKAEQYITLHQVKLLEEWDKAVQGQTITRIN
jgi:hypothetical protein